MSDDRDQRLIEAIYGDGQAAPEDAAEAERLKAFRERLASRLDEVQPPSELRARLVAEARARVRARRSLWAVWAVRLAPIATVVLVVGVWLTVQPRFDAHETATPKQTAARAAAEWAAPTAVPAAPSPPEVEAKRQVAVTQDAPAKEAPAGQDRSAVAPAAGEAEAPVVQSAVARSKQKAQVGSRATRSQAKKDLERSGILTTLGPRGGTLSDAFGSGEALGTGDIASALGEVGAGGVHGGATGDGSVRGVDALGASPDPGDRAVGSSGLREPGGGKAAGVGSGYGRTTDGRGSVSAGDQGAVVATDATEPRTATITAPKAAKVAARPVARNKEEAGDSEARDDEAPRAETTISLEQAPRAARYEPEAPRPDADEASAPAEEKVAASAPAAPQPAVSAAAPAAPAKPRPEVSCRLLEQLLLRATTTAQRVDLSLKLAECRKRAGAQGLARKLLEDLLDDTTLGADDRARVTDALQKL